MKTLAMCALLVLTLVAKTASAFTPSAGLWWNPNEPGRGYNIDVQNDTMVVTAYVYSQSRAATWFLAAGTFTSSNSTFNGTVYADTGGQCWGCSYTSPVESVSGQMSIVFTSGETAILTYPGGSSQIQHYVYGYNNQTDYFLGAWAFSYNDQGLVEGQWISFTGHYTGSDGTVYAAGQEVSQSGTAALGSFYAPASQFIVAIQDNTGFSFIYDFTVGDDRRMLGYGAIYSSGTTPPTPTAPAVATRVLTQAELGGSPLAVPPQPAELVTIQPDDSRYAKLEALVRAEQQRLASARAQ